MSIHVDCTVWLMWSFAMSIVTAACLFTILIQFSCILMASDRTLRTFISPDIKLRELHSVFPTNCTNFHPNRWCERILLYAHSQGNCVCVWVVSVCIQIYAILMREVIWYYIVVFIGVIWWSGMVAVLSLVCVYEHAR